MILLCDTLSVLNGGSVMKAAKRAKRAQMKMLNRTIFLVTELKTREDERFGSVDDSLSS